LSQGYWKTHQELWPVQQLVLGEGGSATIPAGIPSATPLGAAMVAAAGVLDSYNNNRLPDSCGAESGVPPVHGN
jgi:hypothetical protein